MEKIDAVRSLLEEANYYVSKHTVVSGRTRERLVYRALVPDYATLKELAEAAFQPYGTVRNRYNAKLTPEQAGFVQELRRWLQDQAPEIAPHQTSVEATRAKLEAQLAAMEKACEGLRTAIEALAV